MGNPFNQGLPIFHACMKSALLLRKAPGKTWNTAYKVLVLLLLLGILYFELAVKENLDALWALFKTQLASASPVWLLLALILMPLNWMAEAQKWRCLLRRIAPMGLWEAQKAVLAGVAVSIFTPNRIGEIGGRMLFAPPAHYWKVLQAGMLGSLAQLLILLTGGISGTIWLLFHFGFGEGLYLEYWLAPIAGGLVFLYWSYFHSELVLAWLQSKTPLGRIKRFAKVEAFFGQFEQVELWQILAWSLLRFSIYASQYFLLLKFFDIHTGLIMGFSGIFALFLLQTSLPLPPLSGLVARGNLAVWLWGQAGANDLSSLSATFVLWIINLILPALVGTFFLFHVNIAKTFSYENDHH